MLQFYALSAEPPPPPAAPAYPGAREEPGAGSGSGAFATSLSFEQYLQLLLQNQQLQSQLLSAAAHHAAVQQVRGQTRRWRRGPPWRPWALRAVSSLPALTFLYPSRQPLATAAALAAAAESIKAPRPPRPAPALSPLPAPAPAPAASSSSSAPPPAARPAQQSLERGTASGPARRLRWRHGAPHLRLRPRSGTVPLAAAATGGAAQQPAAPTWVDLEKREHATLRAQANAAARALVRYPSVPGDPVPPSTDFSSLILVSGPAPRGAGALPPRAQSFHGGGWPRSGTYS
eukprot:tig00000595_g2260.t1